jgi:hypothetical protein
LSARAEKIGCGGKFQLKQNAAPKFQVAETALDYNFPVRLFARRTWREAMPKHFRRQRNFSLNWRLVFAVNSL